MNNTDRQRLKILVMLVVVFGLALWAGQRIFDVPNDVGGEIGRGNGGPSSNRDDLEPVEVSSRWERSYRVGSVPGGFRRNPFEYGSESVSDVRGLSAVSPVVLEVPGRPIQIPPPSPPSPIPFRYSGWSRVGGDEGELKAWLFDEEEAYNVVEEEVIIGRYRINQITDQFVEIEDLELNSRERLLLFVQ